MKGGKAGRKRRSGAGKRGAAVGKGSAPRAGDAAPRKGARKKAFGAATSLEDELPARPIQRG
jgi:hypothetical protein